MVSKLLLTTLVAACFCNYALASTKIIGGEAAMFGQFKYMASIQHDFIHYCGGAIISGRSILTAAQCNIYPIATLHALVGSNGMNGGYAIEFESFTNHEDYNSETHENDLAIIRVKGSFPSSWKIAPISLINNNNILETDVLVSLGYGYSGSWPKKETRIGLLTSLNTRVLSNENCAIALNGTVGDSKICTLTVEGQGICKGDTGGPLTKDDRLIGIALATDDCGMGRPDVYTRIHTYYNWIQHLS